MRNSDHKRLKHLESKIRSLDVKGFFEEWLKEHHPSGIESYWDILDETPVEFRLECMNRIFEELRAKKGNPSAHYKT